MFPVVVRLDDQYDTRLLVRLVGVPQALAYCLGPFVCPVHLDGVFLREDVAAAAVREGDLRPAAVP